MTRHVTHYMCGAMLGGPYLGNQGSFCGATQSVLLGHQWRVRRCVEWSRKRRVKIALLEIFMKFT